MTSRVLSSLPWPRAQVSLVWRAIAVLCLAEFVRNGLYAAFLPQFGPRNLGMDLTSVALAWSVHYGADTVARSLGGHLVGRVGLRPLAFVGALVTIAVLLLLPSVTTVWQLVLLAAIHGVSFSPLWPGVMTLASTAASKGEQARATSFAHMAIAPFIGVAFLGVTELSTSGAHLGQTSVAWLLLLIVASVPLAFLLGDKWKVATRPLSESSASTTSIREASPSTRRALAVLLPVAVMQTLALTLLGPILATFANRVGLGTLGLTVLVAIGGGLAYLLLNTTGKLADRRGPRFVLLAGLVTIGLGFALAALLPPVWAYFGIAAIVGVGYALMMPGWLGLVAKLLPEKERATRWGVIMTAENVGTTTGPLIGGFAWDALGMRGPFLVGAVLFAVMTAVYVFWKPRD